MLAWGSNDFGQLGTGTTAASLEPVLIDVFAADDSALAGKAVIAIAAGAHHSLALCADGTLAAWGANDAGQLGNNSLSASAVPVAVSLEGALKGRKVIAIAAGDSHSLALCADGTVAAWGDNSNGQLGGAGSAVNSLVPVVVDSSAAAASALAGKQVAAIAAGTHHSLALCTDGTLAAWGANDAGQLGVSSPTSGPVPVAVGLTGALSGRTVSRIAAAGSWNLALCTDGTLAAWGANDAGQLGNNSTTGGPTPVAVDTLAADNSALAGKTISQIAAAARAGLVLCTDGTLAAWGDNASGQLGNNSTTPSLVPAAVNSTSLATGESFTTIAGGANAGQFLALVGIPAYPVVTQPAPYVSGTTANLIGIVNPMGSNRAVFIDYGLTNAYGTSVATLGVWGLPSYIGTSLSGLEPGTTYHYRLRSDTAVGNDVTFTTGGADDNLISLVPSTGTLVPAFAADVTSYQLAVDNTVTSITLTPTLEDTAAVLQVSDARGFGYAVHSGQASASVPLKVGTNTLYVIVTGLAGPRQTYTVTVTRAASLAEKLTSASFIPITANGYTATGQTISLALGYAPVPGASLMIVNNTGTPFINGTFDNLAQGQLVTLSFNGTNYRYVANYYGGTGNDLVLQCADTRVVT